MNISSLQVARFSSAAVWIYQGLVPKLLGPHIDEITMISSLGIPSARVRAVAAAAGMLEVGLGLCILIFYRRAWPHLLSILGLATLAVFVAVSAPGYLVGAFNPVAGNISLAAVSLLAFLSLQELVHAET